MPIKRPRDARLAMMASWSRHSLSPKAISLVFRGIEGCGGSTVRAVVVMKGL